MKLKDKNIIFILTDSFYALKTTISKIKDLIKEGANVKIIMSESVYNIDSKFGKAIDFKNEIIKTTNNKILHKIEDINELKFNNIDALIIAPATGDAIAKLANGISDSIETIAVKSLLRNDKPIILGIAAHDALSTNAENIGKLLNRKNYYFIPFNQDNPITKPYSIMYNSNFLIKTIDYALKGNQIQPIIY